MPTQPIETAMPTDPRQPTWSLTSEFLIALVFAALIALAFGGGTWVGWRAAKSQTPAVTQN